MEDGPGGSYYPAMTKLLACILTGTFFAVATAAHAEDSKASDGARSVVMVELFTSQGCSSCPPADANLAKLARRDNVLVLSMHVDYWDYLGWRDTFGRPENTRRQFMYRDAMGARVVYTPQAIVQGTFDVHGGRMESLNAAIEEARTLPGSATLKIDQTAGMLTVLLGPETDIVPCTVWIAAYDREASVKITRGENAGKTLDYHNVVSKLMRVGHWDGSEHELSLPQPGKGEGIAVWLQDDRTGRVLSVAFVEN